jgi:hypothetical protein
MQPQLQDRAELLCPRSATAGPARSIPSCRTTTAQLAPATRLSLRPVQSRWQRPAAYEWDSPVADLCNRRKEPHCFPASRSPLTQKRPPQKMPPRYKKTHPNQRSLTRERYHRNPNNRLPCRSNDSPRCTPRLVPANAAAAAPPPVAPPQISIDDFLKMQLKSGQGHQRGARAEIGEAAEASGQHLAPSNDRSSRASVRNTSRKRWSAR